MSNFPWVTQLYNAALEQGVIYGHGDTKTAQASLVSAVSDIRER